MGKDPVLATHIVGGFDFRAEGWPAQYQLAFSHSEQIGQIRIALRELLDHERSGQFREARFQVGLQFLRI